MYANRADPIDYSLLTVLELLVLFELAIEVVVKRLLGMPIFERYQARATRFRSIVLRFIAVGSLVPQEQKERVAELDMRQINAAGVRLLLQRLLELGFTRFCVDYYFFLHLNI